MSQGASSEAEAVSMNPGAPGNSGAAEKAPAYTYIVRCADGTYYTGWTNHLTGRIAAHNEGRGAKYTRPRRPVELVYYEISDTKAEAMRREWQIKQLSRRGKEGLMAAGRADNDGIRWADRRKVPADVPESDCGAQGRADSLAVQSKGEPE